MSGKAAYAVIERQHMQRTTHSSKKWEQREEREFSGRKKAREEAGFSMAKDIINL